jgi:hypothetical protein
MLGMQAGGHRDSHEGASLSWWMNLRFDHNLHCTSTHFTGRNQLHSGASTQLVQKQKRARRRSLEAMRDYAGGHQRIEAPTTEAREQWTHVTLWSNGHMPPIICQARK